MRTPQAGYGICPPTSGARVGLGLGNGLGETLSGSSETTPLDNLGAVRDAIARGEFDLVGVGRAILNDPLWPHRVRTGQPALPFDRANLRCLT